MVYLQVILLQTMIGSKMGGIVSKLKNLLKVKSDITINIIGKKVLK